MLLPFFIGLLSLGLFYLVRHLRRNHAALDHLGIPLMPNPWYLGSGPLALHKHQVHELAEERHRKYGKTFGRFDGVTPVINTIDPELIKSITVKNFDSFTGIVDMEVTQARSYKLYMYT